MKVTFAFAKEILAPFITIHAQKPTDELTMLGHSIEELTASMTVIGYQNQRIYRLPLFQINRFHTDGKQVVCETASAEYVIHERLYTLAEQLPSQLFVRISSGEIVRIASIDHFQVTSNGLLAVHLTNGQQTYASRRYTKKLRGLLK